MTRTTYEELREMISNTIDKRLEPLLKVRREFPIPSSAGRINDDVEGAVEGADSSGTAAGPGIRFARFTRSLAAANQGLAGDARGLRGAAYFAEHSLKDSVVARALSASTLSEGGALIPPEFAAEFIEFLRHEATVRRAGALQLNTATGTLLIPKVTSGAVVSYHGENRDVPVTTPSFGQLRATTRKLGALVPISNDLIRSTTQAADVIIRDDLLGAVAEVEDISFIRGSGVEDTPKGILHWTATSNKFNANATVDVPNVNADLIRAIRLVAQAKKRRIRRGGWLFSNRTWAYLFGALTSQGFPVWRSEMATGTLLGYPFFVTGQIPENLGAGSDSEVYFGDFGDAVVVDHLEMRVDASGEAAYRSGNEIVAAFSRDQVVIRILAAHDYVQRYDGSFAVIQAVRWGA